MALMMHLHFRLASETPVTGGPAVLFPTSLTSLQVSKIQTFILWIKFLHLLCKWKENYTHQTWKYYKRDHAVFLIFFKPPGRNLHCVLIQNHFLLLYEQRTTLLIILRNKMEYFLQKLTFLQINDGLPLTDCAVILKCSCRSYIVIKGRHALKQYRIWILRGLRTKPMTARLKKNISFNWSHRSWIQHTMPSFAVTVRPWCFERTLHLE